MMRYIINVLKEIRISYYKHIVWRKYKIGKRFHVSRGVFLWARDGIEIGDDFYIGKYSIIETNCKIGNNVLIANQVGIVGKYDHNYQQIGIPVRRAMHIGDRDYDWKGLNQWTYIEDDVWVGYGSIIMSGAHIGRGSIIAAGSVVTGNVEPFSIYAGVPAKKIKDRFNSIEDKIQHINMLKMNCK